jgi:hypothetical protein
LPSPTILPFLLSVRDQTNGSWFKTSGSLMNQSLPSTQLLPIPILFAKNTLKSPILLYTRFKGSFLLHSSASWGHPSSICWCLTSVWSPEPLISRVTESLLKFLASWGCKVSKKKAQLCLLQVTYLGMILKGQAYSLSHEQIDLILHFPLSQTIKQLRAFLGVTGFCRIWIPRYAALARSLFMLLLTLLFGPFKNKCFLQIHTSTGPVGQIPALSQGILTFASAWALHPVLLGASGDYMGQLLRQVPPPLPPVTLLPAQRS